MRLDGIHHVTAITGDAPANVEFYTRILGLRMVKKSVNQDDPTIYHLFYADEDATPGSDITFFEYPGAARGRPGAGMVHRVVWRVSSPDALRFWQTRLEGEGLSAHRTDASLIFSDPEGLSHELIVGGAPDEPLIADHPQIPAPWALQGLDAVRSYSSAPAQTGTFLGALGFSPGAAVWTTSGGSRHGSYVLDDPPAHGGLPGAGTVHHVAWACTDDDHAAWRERVLTAGGRPTPVIDRYWFRSIYFHEPGGVLFEIATLGPGFGVDEDKAHLGERLTLPPGFEHMRPRLEEVLTTLPDTSAWRRERGQGPSSAAGSTSTNRG